ncbi:hypothetical protein SAMN05421870_10214 [Streptomyces qinglanensis]|uniref:Transposase DDE domain-containing protein n=1 Tax=Streptomyces qinglanensis TaxID=943816 RepID=A0A1H9PHB1_9ACTN|nr:hypothetical protein SAMN05421870_10214 [Streptomyces qinglanensis]
MAWLGGCRRLHRRYERKAEHFLAFASLAYTLICYRRLLTPSEKRMKAGPARAMYGVMARESPRAGCHGLGG